MSERKDSAGTAGQVERLYALDLSDRRYSPATTLDDHTHVINMTNKVAVGDWENSVRITSVAVGSDYRGSFQMPKGTEYMTISDLKDGSQIVEFYHAIGARRDDGEVMFEAFLVEKRTGKASVSLLDLIAGTPGTGFLLPYMRDISGLGK